MSEKIGGVKGSQLEEDFIELERVSLMYMNVKVTDFFAFK